MAAPNKGLFSEIFSATQVQVQVICITVHTQIYRHGPHGKLEETEPRMGLGFKVLMMCKVQKLYSVVEM
jgi:hypothetical protein